MSISKRCFLRLVALLFFAGVSAASAASLDMFADVLYWHTTETVDWAYTNRSGGDRQEIDFKTLTFDWDPGFRVGLGYNACDWDTAFYYTQFSAKADDSASGVVTSGFLGTKVAGYGTYTSAEAHLKIDLHMFDWDLKAHYPISPALFLCPLIGVKGGWINQYLHTAWQYQPYGLKAVENLQNNFSGAGPKAGLSTTWCLCGFDRWCVSIIGDFAASYLWGQWEITDHFADNFTKRVTPKVGNRHFGALVLQGLLGLSGEYEFCQERVLTMKLCYEIGDWLDQYQVFDNLTGGHSNDLLLQGVTLDLGINF